MNKIILHVDFDMFFAAVEILEDPYLKGKSVAVAPDVRRGIITTASYEARQYGIGSGMAIETAKSKCPHLILIPPHMDKYERVNSVFRSLIEEYTDVFEFVALDEAYLDITYTYEFHSSPSQLAINLQKEIYRKTGCTCSVGLGYNKISAKLASERNKPNGFGKILNKKEFLDYTENKKLTKINGIGARMAERLYKFFYVKTLGELRRIKYEELKFYFKKPGINIYYMIRGKDYREVGDSFKRDGYASRQTFQEDLFGDDIVLRQIINNIEKVSWQLKKDGKSAHTITLIIRYSDTFIRVTKSKTFKMALREPIGIHDVVKDLAKKLDLNQNIRQIGIRLSNTTRAAKTYQLTIGETESFERKKSIYKLTYELKQRFGEAIIHDPIAARKEM